MRSRIAGSAPGGFGFAEKAARAEELAEGFAVVVAREPRLAPLRRVQLRVVPPQRPGRRVAAFAGRADERRIGHAGKSLTDSKMVRQEQPRGKLLLATG